MKNPNDLTPTERLEDWLTRHPVPAEGEFAEIFNELRAEGDDRGAYFFARGIITFQEARDRDY